MHLTYRFAYHLFRTISHGYFGCDVYNSERVPLEGPVILASNHASFYDPFLVGCMIKREIFYLARKTAFFFPLGPVIKSWNAVPVDRDGGGPKGMMQIIGHLQSGKAIVLFPEGTRTNDGQLQPVRAGIGFIVIKSTAPVVPVRVFGAYEAWNRKMIFPRPRHRLAVKYGHPMQFAALREEAQTCSRERLKTIYQEVADQIMANIRDLKPCRDD